MQTDAPAEFKPTVGFFPGREFHPGAAHYPGGNVATRHGPLTREHHRMAGPAVLQPITLQSRKGAFP